MNIGLVIGKKNSLGLPNKNIKMILGRPSAEYAFIAAKYSIIDKVYVSTDSDEIKSIGQKYGAIIIDRPISLAQPETLTEEVLSHAYEIIKKDNNDISSITLLFSNTPTIDVDILNESIQCLNESETIDSIFSVAKYDMFTPTRARKLDDDGTIKPFIDLNLFQNVSSIRDSAGETYFCDLSIQVMKEVCFSEIENGPQPFRWQGHKSKAIKVDFGFDIDKEWQIPVVEYWLKKKGFSAQTVPWEEI